MAKELFERMVRTGEEPAAIVQREGLRQVADEGAIGQAIDEVVAAHPSVVDGLSPRARSRPPGSSSDRS